MGGTPAKMFPMPGGLGQSQQPNILNQAIAPPKLTGNPLLSLSGASYEPSQPAIQQPVQPPLNPMQNSPFYGGAGRGRDSMFRPY